MTALGSLTIFYRTTLYHNSSNAMEQTDAVLSTLNDLLSLMFLSVSGGGYFEFPIMENQLLYIRDGHRVLFRSERSVLFRSFKECNVLFRSFFEFLATYETQKNVTFFSVLF